MATIPTIESSENVNTGPVLQGARPGDFEPIKPQALATWSEAIDNTADVQQKKQLQSDHFWASTNMANGQIAMTKNFSDMRDNMEPGDPSFADKVLSANQAIIKDQLKGAPNGRAKGILQHAYLEYLPHTYAKAEAAQQMEGIRFRTQTTEDTFNAMFDSVRQNPSTLQDGVATLQAQLKAAEGRIPQSNYKALEKKLQTLPSFALEGLSMRDPALALRAINEGAYQDVPQDQRDTLKQQLEPQVGLLAATDAQSQSRALKQAITEVKATGKYSNGFDANTYASNFKKTGDAHYMTASDQLEQAAHFYDADSPMLYMNPVQMRDHIEKFRPQPNDAEYGKKAGLYNELLKSANARGKALAGDPFAYSLNVPQIKVSYDVASNLADEANKDPSKIPQAQTAMEKAIDQSLAYQKTIGMTDNSQRVVSKQASQFYASMVQTSAPAQVQGVIAGLQQKFGRFFPQVLQGMQDLPKGQRIDPGYQLVVSHLGMPYTNQLITALRQDKKELDASIGPESKKTITKALPQNELVSAFKRSIVSSSPGNLDYANEVVDEVGHYAKSLAAGGMEPSKAVGAAAETLIGNLYDFHALNERTYAIRKFSDTGKPYNDIQLSTIKSNLSHLLSNYNDIGNSSSLSVPKDVSEKLGEKYGQESIGKSLANQGYWVTLPDNSGVALRMRGSDGVSSGAVMHKDGSPVKYRFDDLNQYDMFQHAVEVQRNSPGLFSQAHSAPGLYEQLQKEKSPKITTQQ